VQQSFETLDDLLTAKLPAYVEAEMITFNVKPEQTRVQRKRDEPNEEL